jgi:ABC-type lipoprotein release transport system permease subunit
VTRLVLGQSLRLTTLGGAAGLAIALAAAPWIQRFLFRTSARDATTLGLAVAVLVVVGCVAALVPTWRAARVDPVTTLRAE